MTEDTQALIARLSAAPVPPRLSGAALAGAWAAALVPAVALMLVVLGLRADPGPPVALVKVALPGGLAAMALILALRSARPVGAVPVGWLWLPLVVAAGLWAVTLAQTPVARVGAEVMGQTAAACLVSITALSLAPLAAGLALLRRGAPLRPALSGALIGLAAGAGAAAGYALHCTEDSPLFFVLWYGMGIAIAAGLGALAGRRWLRW